jgi:hypothetical protein
MDKKEAKMMGAKFLNRVQDVVTNPKVLKTSKVTKKVLDIAAVLAQAKLRGPVSIASAAISSIDAINEVFELPKDRVVREYVRQYGLVPTDSKIPLILERLGVFARLDNFHSSPNLEMYRYVHENGEQIVFKGSGNRASNIDGTYWRTPGFKTQYLKHLIWPEDLDVFILSYNGMNHTLDIAPSAFRDTRHYISFEHHTETVIKHAKRTHEHGMSYAATLIGNPGSGKTTFVHKIANDLGLKLLHVASDITEDVTSTQFEEIVNTLQPDVLLLDDVDRSDFYEGLMASIEPIREKNPNTIVLSTCNSWPGDALMRPGRLGDVLVFLPPRTQEARAKLLTHYMKVYKTDPEKYPVEAIAKEIQHPRITQDYIRFVAQKSMILDPDELLAFAKELKQHWEFSKPTTLSKDGYAVRTHGASQYRSFDSFGAIYDKSERVILDQTLRDYNKEHQYDDDDD